MTRSSRELEAGLQVGSSVLRESIAEGGFGSVWLADHKTRGPVAVKILRSDFLGSAEVVARFEREANTIASISHPNVIALYEFGRLATDGRPYFVMEFIDGITLESHIENHGALSTESALAIVDSLAAALQTAHERGIVHRDLKASNVMLADVDRVVLLDFGVAKLLNTSGPGLTASRSTVGTPSCMAPEQLRGLEVGPKTDIYALGGLTFHMLTGRRPFSEGASLAAQYMHLYGRRPLVSDVSNISPIVDSCIVSAMAKQPSDRHDSALEFAQELHTVLAPSHARSLPSTSQQGFGLYVQATLANGVSFDTADDELLSELESILPKARRLLRAHGFSVIESDDHSALFGTLTDPAPEHARNAASAASDVYHRLAHPEPPQDAVRVSMFLHRDTVEVIESTIVGGALLETEDWVDEAMTEGLFGTASSFRDLSLPVTTTTNPALVELIGSTTEASSIAEGTPTGLPRHEDITPLRILVVDDEDEVLRSVRRMLRNFPFEITTCSSADHALALMHEQPPDVVLTDYQMGGKPGTWLLGEVRDKFPTLRRVLCSGTEYVEIVRDNDIAVAHEFVAKPLSRTLLLSAILGDSRASTDK